MDWLVVCTTSPSRILITGVALLRHAVFSSAAIVELYSTPVIGQKVVLNLMDGLAAAVRWRRRIPAQLRGALRDSTREQGSGGGRRIALQRIEEWRKKAALPPIGDRQRYSLPSPASRIGNGDACTH